MINKREKRSYKRDRKVTVSLKFACLKPINTISKKRRAKPMIGLQTKSVHNKLDSEKITFLSNKKIIRLFSLF